MKRILASTALVSVMAMSACQSTVEEEVMAEPAMPEPPAMSFFVTSRPHPNGANLGGLEGADAMCQALASEVGAGDHTWRAYLSAEATSTSSAVNARDRIGFGPWYNANGEMIARDVFNLHDADGNNLNKQTALTERGEMVNGVGDDPLQHDILTGSFDDGTVYIEKDVRSATCLNWTNGGQTDGVFARVGHHDRMGRGPEGPSWNSAHNSRGCGLEDLRPTGGDGRFYCFAAD